MKYDILRRLGSGGFGNVYEVCASNGKIYAMKLLKDLNATNKKRFEREIKILAKLNHPNIVKIFEWKIVAWSNRQIIPVLFFKTGPFLRICSDVFSINHNWNVLETGNTIVRSLP